MTLPTTVVLAGGLGTRIRHLLAEKPKPLAEVAGRPFLSWVLAFLAGQGVTEVVVSAGYQAQMIEDFCRTADLKDVAIECVAETTAQGTGGGFLMAAARSDRPSWLVANGDSLICADIRSFVAACQTRGCDAGLIALPVEDGRRFGTLRFDEDGNLLAFAEKQAEAGPGTINAGIYYFHSSTIPKFPKQRPLSFETDVFPELLRLKTNIYVHTVAAPFIDIGTELSLLEAEAFIQNNSHYFK